MMDGSNKRGRPHREWSDDIEQWCGTTLQELSHAAYLGQRWAAIVTMASDTNGHWAHGCRWWWWWLFSCRQTLTFWGHVTSSVTWPFDSRGSTSYERSRVPMRVSSTVMEKWPSEVLPGRLFQEQRSVVGRSSIGRSVLNITLILYTSLRYVRNVSREEWKIYKQILMKICVVVENGPKTD